MLVTHLNNSEGLLLKIIEIPSISGHPLHKGALLDVFVRDFLQDHLALTLAIGSGELIEANPDPTILEPTRHHHLQGFVPSTVRWLDWSLDDSPYEIPILLVQTWTSAISFCNRQKIAKGIVVGTLWTISTFRLLCRDNLAEDEEF
jgi:hypothetical protein